MQVAQPSQFQSSTFTMNSQIFEKYLGAHWKIILAVIVVLIIGLIYYFMFHKKDKFSPSHMFRNNIVGFSGSENFQDYHDGSGGFDAGDPMSWIDTEQDNFRGMKTDEELSFKMQGGY